MTFEEFLQDARTTRRTLTLYGDVSDSTLADLRRFFDAMNVRVEVTEPELADADPEVESDAHPAGTAVLAEDGRVVETGSLGEIVDYVEVDPELPDATASETPAVVEAADATVTAFENEGRRHLVRGSQVIEELAWENRTGTLHAGFQRFSRLVSFGRTREVFRRLAEVGVDVHVYGLGDADLPDDAPYAVHPRDDAETRDHWFVTYRCEEQEECAALVAHQVTEDEYEGFWTLDAERARPIADYVEETYANH